MKKSKSGIFIFVFLIFCIDAFAQIDSINKLSFDNFLQMVKKHHPLAKQANLIVSNAQANSLQAKGNFDPKLFYDFRNKFYDSKTYYQLGNGGFYVPTWFGLEFKAGYEQNQGSYIDPENLTPENGLLYSQISFPLLQGLLIDERRSVLKQANLFKELSEFDKINAINELLYKAGKSYLDWHLSYSNLQVLENAVALSQLRFEAIKRTSILGDRPYIDTIEAKIQWQDRIVNLQQGLMDFRTKSLLVSNFLWIENNIPIELSKNTIPSSDEIINENYLSANVVKIDSVINVHPNLKVYEFKLKQLAIEKKFKQDKLKPNLRVNYNPLFKADNLNLSYQNNYKWGVSLGFPILLRKERGDLQLTKIKIENTKFETLNKRNELTNKTKASINEFNSFKNQLEVFAGNVLNYERLWLSEKQLFDSGESSLFMINSREMSYINSQIKLNEIKNKTQKSALELEYNFGVLNSNY